MAEMKDSGTAWLGMIPKDWELSKISSIYELRTQKVSDKDYPPLSVTMNGIVPQLDSAAKTNAHDDRKLVKKGDFAINSRSDRRGSCGVSEYDGSVSLINTVMKPRDEMNPDYYNWLFHTIQFADEFYKWGHGIVDDLWTTNWQDMKHIDIPVPTLDEQKVIADYLNKAIPEIDALHTDIEKQIETLEEYKKSIITEAVTKGLINININGTQVDFTNTTDEQWECKKLKLLVAMPIIDGPHESPELCDTGIPYISATAIVDGKIDFNLMRGYISEEYCTECEKRYKPQLNDILVVKLGAGTGQVAMVDDNRKFNIWVPLAAVRCNELVIPKFIYYGFQSDYVVTQMEQSWTYGTQETLGIKTIEKLKFFIPTLNTQRKIIQYLDNKCVNIDGAIEEKIEQLETLEQYKKSLIYEYVSGKKEVK